jgi:hypothetical protein
MEAIAQPVAVSSKLKHGRGAASNDPGRLGRLTPRAQARRRRDLIRTFLAALGGADSASPVAMLQIKKAAELLSLAEAVRAGLIGNPTRDVTGLVRLEGEARRTLRLLGIKTEPAAKSSGGLTIARARWEEQRAQEQAKKAREATTAKDTEVPSDGRAA